MTVEEMEQMLQRVAVAIGQITEAAVRADERLDATDTSRREADQRIEALIGAQVRYEARQEKLEESFHLVAQAHAHLVEMIRLQEDRLDGHDSSHERTDGRLDALIDGQIGFNEKLQAIGRAQADDRRQAEERGRLLDEKLKRLSQAQARADEQIRLLTDRGGEGTR